MAAHGEAGPQADEPGEGGGAARPGDEPGGRHGTASPLKRLMSKPRLKRSGTQASAAVEAEVAAKEEPPEPEPEPPAEPQEQVGRPGRARSRGVVAVGSPWTPHVVCGRRTKAEPSPCLPGCTP